MAKQLIADLYGCDRTVLDDEASIISIAHNSVAQIGASIVQESIKKFDPIGITYFAVISTSHFSIHTWPEYGYVAIDVFSCNEIVVKSLLALLESSFRATKIKTNIIERRVEAI